MAVASSDLCAKHIAFYCGALVDYDIVVSDFAFTCGDQAAIDAIAEMTLCGDAADKYRLSLGGVSSSGKEPLALQEFLRQHPEITTIELRLDNDAKGRMASVGIRKIYADRYTVHDLPPDIENGDYADMAKNNLMARTAAHRAEPCR